MKKDVLTIVDVSGRVLGSVYVFVNACVCGVCVYVCVCVWPSEWLAEAGVRACIPSPCTNVQRSVLILLSHNIQSTVTTLLT